MRDDFALVKTRLYQIMYVSAKKTDLNTPKVLAFFNSFKLTDIPETEVVKEPVHPANKRQLEFTLPSDWIVQSDKPIKDGTTTTLAQPEKFAGYLGTCYDIDGSPFYTAEYQYRKTYRIHRTGLDAVTGISQSV